MTTPSRRIMSQKEMRDARQLIPFCYLCGRDLPSRDKPGWRGQITGEHVIPRALLGDVPESQAEKWAIELDVHRECEQVSKQHVDHWLKLVQEIHIKPGHEWPKRGHLRDMPIRPSRVIDPRTGDALCAFTGCSGLLDGVWRWVRGMHAALYSQFLSADVWHCSYPPVPACNNQGQGPTLEETQGIVMSSDLQLILRTPSISGMAYQRGVVPYAIGAYGGTVPLSKADLTGCASGV